MDADGYRPGEYGSLTPSPEGEKEEKRKKSKRTVIALAGLAALLAVGGCCVGSGLVQKIIPQREEEVVVVEPADDVYVAPTPTEYIVPLSPTPTEAAQEPVDFIFPGGFANYIRWDPESPIESWNTPVHLEFSSMDESGEVWLSGEWYVDEGYSYSDIELLSQFEAPYSVFNPYMIFAMGAPLIIPDGREISFRGGFEPYEPISPSGQGIEEVLGKEVEYWTYSESVTLDHNGCEMPLDYEMHFDKSSGLLISYREDYAEACGQSAHSYITELVETNIPLGTGN